MLPNSPATIDPDYRGELRVIVWNSGAEPVPVPRGMRIAQLVFARFEVPDIVEVDELSGSERGIGGIRVDGALIPFRLIHCASDRSLTISQRSQGARRNGSVSLRVPCDLCERLQFRMSDECRINWRNR